MGLSHKIEKSVYLQFFKKGGRTVYGVQSDKPLRDEVITKLQWMFDGAVLVKTNKVTGKFIGPRKEMISPWSTNAVEIARNMGITGITRIEQFVKRDEYDPMIEREYNGMNSKIFDTDREAEDVIHIDNLEEYNEKEGLALSKDEIEYLKNLSKEIGRPLTDSEVFGFSQVNSEHCRHKIFNGKFIIDGKEKELSLFKMIKQTSEENPNELVSAYKDNVAFVKGPKIKQFSPITPYAPSLFAEREIDTVISLKAETHNFPTTVEPFNGAATGTGGEIRDRMGGGKSSIPIAGTAVYMTSYPRPEERRSFECGAPLARPWLYQTPAQILIKASNGASDFGNKFGQPLICGSVLTFEHEEHNRLLAYDKVIMLAGGVGFGKLSDALKDEPEPGMKVVVMGGDNYRIGMGGGAVSSVETGQYENSIELNAVQRANPEMQKRVSNVVRALAEMEHNPCVSIHDHGAGGHLNALSELVEATGGKIKINELPVGDNTLSSKEIIGNESQERMGLLLHASDVDKVRKIAEREQAPFYVVGETTSDNRFVFEESDGSRPIDLAMSAMFGNSPKTVMTDITIERKYSDAEYSVGNLQRYLQDVLRLEAVACKDWLTNKVDRSVTGRVARQQCQGPLQLPLSDCGVVALDYHGKSGIATSIGHAPQAALIDSAKGSILSIAESLTNICGAPLKDGLKSVSLSANWMWPCRNEGEDAALYKAVEACSLFARQLGINIPTGKDSLSMTQKYGERKVMAPGTVIISAAGEVSDIRKVVSPVIRKANSKLLYIDFSGDEFKLGGSSFFQSLNKVGLEAPTITSAPLFAACFEGIQHLVNEDLVLSMHDVSAGGLIVTLLEMAFANISGGVDLNLDVFDERDAIKILFSENPAVVVEVEDSNLAKVEDLLKSLGVMYLCVGCTTSDRQLNVYGKGITENIDIDAMRNEWYRTSHEMDLMQTAKAQAEQRYHNYSEQPVTFKFPKKFDGKFSSCGINENRISKSGIRAAIIRDKGINSDREMAYSLHLAGFDVRDVHTTDLTSGRENLEDINLIVFCGGFSNSDVLGSAKGWAGQFLYNEQAKRTLENYFKRNDTLSLGVCNGCQLMVALNLLKLPESVAPKMEENNSGKFESNFLTLDIPRNNSVMLGSLAGSRIGVWVAHGEGKFVFPGTCPKDIIAAKYTYKTYPGNPNGTSGSVAAICSEDGRHLAIMPHPERSIFPWQWGWYPEDRKDDMMTPWLEAFVNARNWVEKNRRW
ncbi:MAG: phosphoribosylformylglycinamidine synthase [Prevotella sp.]|nr:phosphoribosylformylglycinamidine synthase [Bacteroides sp.]MCM1366915.1 phosphoribosylformylglycinamidine synthase [Prevotella sp.]